MPSVARSHSGSLHGKRPLLTRMWPVGFPLDAPGETLAWSLHTAVARNPRPHHAPGTGAKPGLTKGFGDSSAVPGLQGRFVPERPGYGASQVYGTVFFTLVVVAGSLFSRSVNTLVSPGCVH